MRRPARGIVQLLPAALLFGLGPIALATLAFEYTDRHSRPRVHHLPDDPWLSAALALRFAQRLGGGKFIAEKVHHSLLSTAPATPATFAKTLGKTATVGEPRATHRPTRRPYKTRVRMPSKLDPHIATIEGWLIEEPQLTALAIVCRLSEKYPEEFGTRQHSIVQRLLRTLRRKAAEQLVARGPLGDAATAAPSPGVVDGSGYAGPDPPTAPLVEQAGKATWGGRSIIGSSSAMAPSG
jgi:hypothetical protein